MDAPCRSIALKVKFLRWTVDYHFDRTAKLDTQPEHPSLYRWSIQEFSAEGEKIGRDLIPWEWSLNFFAEELILSETVRASRFLTEKPDTTVRRMVVAKLKAGKGEFGPVRFSMIGTSRNVEDITVRIEALGSEDDTESCSMAGVVAFTTEVNFRNRHFPDSLEIYLNIKPSSFSRLADLVARSHVSELHLRLAHVIGFYSDWSPSVVTDSIKVLTANEKHIVETGLEGDFKPPRISEVIDFSLTTTVKTVFQKAVDEPLSGAVEEEPKPEPKVLVLLERMTAAFEVHGRRLGALTSLQWAAWIAVIFLAAIELKGCGA